MKNLTSALTFTSILLSIPLGIYISKILDQESKELNLKNTVPVKFDDSLRNYHPNKGE